MAYASLVCLPNTLDENIQLNLIPQNSQYIQTLLPEANLFQDFLDKTSHKISEKVKCLETRMRDVAYKAQDIVDTHVANRILDESVSKDEGFTSLFQDLNEVIEEISSIKQEVMQMNEEDTDEEKPGVQSTISLPAGSSSSSSIGTTTMIGLEDDLMKIRERLLGNSLKLEIISLVGMGGIGKTTLATKIYDDSHIAYHFDMLAWATVSQEYNVRNILLDLLGNGKTSAESDGALADKLHKRLLTGMRFLIVLDDLWDTRVLDDLRQIFPNDRKGSRILQTTMLEKVAKQANSCPPLHHVQLLKDEDSWSLFCEKAFKNGCCPLQLEEIGKKIVRNCRGLPLAIKVIGGHLSNATRTEHYWRSVAKNLSETITSKDDEQCSKILSLNYKHLPNHLKGCFLYMSIFPEDYEITVSILVDLWIASGLIKQETCKSSKDVAIEYFFDLVKRNLILVCGRDYSGKIMRCKIHDLIMDLCVKEAKNESFFHITNKTFYFSCSCAVVPATGGLRAFFCDEWDSRPLPTVQNNLANLRYFYYRGISHDPFTVVPFHHKLVHLHTIHTMTRRDYLWLNIWKMPQLRDVNYKRLSLPDPPSEIEVGNSLIVLEKLETLVGVRNLIFTDEVLRRIPNLKRLGIHYVEPDGNVVTDWRVFCLNNLERLHKLESLECKFHRTLVQLRRDIAFPPWIKKLTLEYCRSPWEDVTIVGSLPYLQVLELGLESFIGEEWVTNEREFRNLKSLLLDELDLVHWRAEADHFPQLQYLLIINCKDLRKIPKTFAEIPTLQLIKVAQFTESVYHSGRKIEKQQHDFGNEGFQFITYPRRADRNSSEESPSSSDSQEAPSEEESTSNSDSQHAAQASSETVSSAYSTSN